MITPELWMNEKLGSSASVAKRDSAIDGDKRQIGDKRPSYVISDRKDTNDSYVYNGTSGESGAKRLRRDHERAKRLHSTSSGESTLPVSSPRGSSHLSSSPHNESPDNGGSSGQSRFVLDSMTHNPALHHPMLGLYPPLWGAAGSGASEMLPHMLWDPRALHGLQMPPGGLDSARKRGDNRTTSRHSPGHDDTPTEGTMFYPPGAPPPLLPPQHRGSLPPLQFMGGLPSLGLPPAPSLPGLLPPNTLMTPYPVIVPLPIPIPIPIPVKEDLFYTYLKKANEKSTEPAEAQKLPEEETAEEKEAVAPIVIKPTNLLPDENDEDESNNPLKCACYQNDGGICNEELCTRSAREKTGLPPHEEHRTSPRRLPLLPEQKSEDVAMDLSKVKSDRVIPIASPSSTAGQCKPLNVVDQNKTPMVKIPPLMAPMPTHPPILHAPMMPVRELPYSSRRALLLDAPSVRRDVRDRHSPSPDKRLMFRSPSRDIIINKRKCGVRPRIKSK